MNEVDLFHAAVRIYLQNGGNAKKAVDEAYAVEQAVQAHLEDRVPEEKPAVDLSSFHLTGT